MEANDAYRDTQAEADIDGGINSQAEAEVDTKAEKSEM